MNGEAFERLDWDSRCFGFGTARILLERADTPALEDVLANMAGQGIRLAYWSTRPEDCLSNTAATSCNGFLVDRKITYGRPTTHPLPVKNASRVRRFSAEDSAERLMELAMEAGKYSRFKSDPRFPPESFRALYREWMRKSMIGEIADEILVATEKGALMGLITMRAREASGQVGLFAVAREMQGKGFGTDLLGAAVSWFSSQACQNVAVVTQEANHQGCRHYERNGFTVSKREFIHHFWLGA